MAGRRARNKAAGQGTQTEHPAGGTSPWEAGVGALGLLLVLATVGFLAHQALTTRGASPAISVEVVAVSPISGGHLVRFRARNAGERTAAAVRIRGELRREATIIERNVAVLDYLPAAGEREGGLIFQEDPNSYQLRLSAEGYADP